MVHQSNTEPFSIFFSEPHVRWAFSINSQDPHAFTFPQLQLFCSGITLAWKPSVHEGNIRETDSAIPKQSYSLFFLGRKEGRQIHPIKGIDIIATLILILQTSHLITLFFTTHSSLSSKFFLSFLFIYYISYSSSWFFDFFVVVWEPPLKKVHEPIKVLQNPNFDWKLVLERG